MCSFAEGIWLKNQNKDGGQPQNQTEPKPNPSNYRANHDHERAVGYDWPDSQRIAYKIEKEQHVRRLLCLMVFQVGPFVNYIAFTK